MIIATVLATQLAMPAAAPADEPCPQEHPRFSLLRYEESYTFLEDPRCRTEFWDRVKYMPIGRRSGWYLSLGGEIRERYEFFHDEDAASAPADREGNNSYARHRYLLHGDLHLGPAFRAFVQVLSGLETGGWSVDAFWSKPVRNRAGVFDDDPDPERSLWGLYAVTAVALLPDGRADLYYLGYENRRARFDQRSGYELRHTTGIRLWGQPGPWEYDVELIGQFGQFSLGTIGAWGVGSATHYNFATLPLRPRLGLRTDVTTGDRDPKSVNLQTFNALFPTGAYDNLMDPVGPQNLIHVMGRGLRDGVPALPAADGELCQGAASRDGPRAARLAAPVTHRGGALRRGSRLCQCPGVCRYRGSALHAPTARRGRS